MTARRIRLGSNPRSGLAAGRRPRFRCTLSPANRGTACTARWMRGRSARGKIAGRETLAINPVDAQRRSIGDGEVVRVFNARGACFVGVCVTEAVRPGVVRLSCGAWYDPAGDEDEPACAYGNANVLTRDHGTSRLSQGPSSATALVEVAKCADPPPVRVFAPVP